MKVVKKAEIEVVTIRELREGDKILWSNLRCRVIEIDRHNRKVIFAPSSLPASAKPFEGSYMHYYRVLKCEEINTCMLCGKEIEEGDICKECKEENLGIEEEAMI